MRDNPADQQKRVHIGDAVLEVTDIGAGEPVVFAQTALTADELLPVAHATADAGYRCIVYQRRGYAGSSPVIGPGSINRDAADCAALLTALRIERAHVVGVSYSGAVGLQVAADEPHRVRSLTVIEPPPVHVPSTPEFRAANDRLIDTRQALGPWAALDEFLTMVIGPNWLADVERALPGSAAQMERDTTTFFDTDLPALFTWDFGAADARRIGCPVLHIGGSASGPWFAEVREQILQWLPDATDVVIDGADHSLCLTHSDAVAAALVDFLHRQN